MTAADRIAAITETAVSCAKLLTQSRRSEVSRSPRAGETLVIMGNGPSLARDIAERLPLLQSVPTMAVNFAANAPEFEQLRPTSYILADPHFFSPRGTDPNLDRLIDRLDTLVTWPMTLYLPMGRDLGLTNPNIRVEHFNFLGIEGPDWLTHRAYRAGRGMPRPRNVLVPAIMTAILAGFKKIAIAGADHTWTQTLSVDDSNMVVTVQPHFYKDNNEEKARVTSVYKDVRLHDILDSFRIAFRSYHEIACYAAREGVEIL
ncbi:MAG: hypothetical protein K2H87_09410, partial [Duncaniella sp.]|nr:hypothetical protein [Duncaniella sp.]